MYPRVTHVAAGNDYLLTVTFEGGEQGTLDIKPMLHFGVFQRLQDQPAAPHAYG